MTQHITLPRATLEQMLNALVAIEAAHGIKEGK